MLSSKKFALLSIITTFLVGVALGVVVERFVFDTHHKYDKRDDPNEHIMQKFTTELSLTPAQQDTLAMLLDDIKEKHRALRKERHKEYERIRKEFEQEFSSILDERQAARYEEMVREYEREREERRKVRDKKGE